MNAHLRDEKNVNFLKKGSQIGEIFEVIRMLGQSAVNDAYLVRNTVTGKRYALKLLLPDYTLEDNFDEHFEEVRKNIGDFIHPNIVGIYKIGSSDDDYYLVSSFVTALGGAPRTLQEHLIRHGRMHEFQAKNVFLQLCGGLQHAATNTKNPVSHWDLKPSNILFDSTHLVRIADFSKLRFVPDEHIRKVVAGSGFDRHVLQRMGFPARLMPGFGTEADDTESTSRIDMEEYSMVGARTGHERRKIVAAVRHDDGPVLPRLERIANSRFRSLAESFTYMSPEQRAGHPPDQRSNIFSLGIIMYEMLTGIRFTAEDWLPPSHAGCGNFWDDIIRRCVEPSPDRRYQSLAALQHDIIQGTVKRSRFLPLTIYAGATLIVGLIMYVAIQWVFAPYNFAEQVESLNRAIVDSGVDISSKYSVMDLKIVPSGASVEIFHKKNLVKKINNITEGGMKYIVPPGEYLIEVYKEGFSPIKEKIMLNPGNFQVALTLTRNEKISVRQYIYKKDQLRPEVGFPFIIPRLGLELLPITPGKFVMGTGQAINSETQEQPARQATIAYPFWIARHETSQHSYESVMLTNPSVYESSGSNRPVEKVSWNKARQFCERLTIQEKNAGRLPSGCEYRLPTEEEWEYCCRAGTVSNFSFGDDDKVIGEYAWFSGNGSSETHEVGKRKPNRWGIYDMHGNVAEWTWNSYSVNKSPVPNEKNPEKKVVGVLRGGSWRDTPLHVRSSSRIPVDSGDFADSHAGFRVVLGPVRKTDSDSNGGK